MKYTDYLGTIEDITIVSSAGCNLNCKYCFLASTVNDYAATLQKNTIQALKDGTYLNNVKKIFLKLNLPIANVKKIDFWGQEPTLTLEHVTNNLEDWLSVFTGLNTTFFSTNGVAYSQKIVDYILKMDSLIDRPFQVGFQVSYDGSHSNENNRRVQNQTILNNIQHIINEINKVSLKHVNVRIDIHGVVSNELVYELNSYDKVKEYFLNLNKDFEPIFNSIINKNIEFFPTVSLNPQSPIKSSSEDGLIWNLFFQRAKKLYLEPEFKANPHYRLTIDATLSHITAAIQNILHVLNVHSLTEGVTKLQSMSEEELIEISKEISVQSSCGNNHHDFKILYDGTLCNCQNSLFETKKEYIKKEDTLEYYVKESFCDHDYFVNPLIDSDEKLEKSFYMFNLLKNTGFYYTYAQTISMMYYLSKVKQIDSIYAKDYEKLLEHALGICMLNQCSFNNQMFTGSMFNKDSGMLRRFLNGIMNNLDYQSEEML